MRDRSVVTSRDFPVLREGGEVRWRHRLLPAFLQHKEDYLLCRSTYSLRILRTKV